MTTETIDRLYLELPQFLSAKTANDLANEKLIATMKMQIKLALAEVAILSRCDCGEQMEKPEYADGRYRCPGCGATIPK